jgi:hypothetical protein
MIRARLGAGRRLSGEHCKGCIAIGEGVGLHPLQPVVLYAKPGSTGTLARKEDFYKSKRGARWSCRARVDPKARRLEQHRDFGSLPYKCGARDMMRTLNPNSLDPSSCSLQPDPGQPNREGCDEYTESAVGGQCLFVLLVGIGDWSYRALPRTATRV